MPTVFEDQLTNIGRVVKTIGYKGVVLIEPNEGFENTWADLTKCIIKVNGVWAPFFIESKEESGDEWQLKFVETNSDQNARILIHQDVFVLQKEIHPDDGEIIPVDDSWIGYQLVDSEFGTIGPIEEIEELPGQDLLHVLYQDRLVAIPLAEDLIVSIDPNKRILEMNLPYGLFDI